MLKPNLWWVTGKTEPMENLENWINRKFTSQPVFWVKCRKVTTHKCLLTNVLNIKTEPRMGDGEKLSQWKIQKTESTENLHLGRFCKCQQKRNISVSHYEKIEKWPPFHKYRSYGKNSNYQPSPKFGSPVLWVLTEMEYQCWPLWKNRKMAAIP